MLRAFALLPAVVLLHLAPLRAEDKDNPLEDPKSSIAHQLKLLQDGKTDELRACFVDAKKELVTKEAVESASKKLAKLTIDDIFESVKLREFDGKKTAKVMMKGGKRTLTTLTLIDGKWLSGSIWFR